MKSRRSSLALAALFLTPLAAAGGGGLTSLGSLPLGTPRVNGLSRSGDVVVGSVRAGYDAMNYPYDHAVLWTEATGWVDIDAASHRFSYGEGVSADGSTIVGRRSSDGAFRWSQALGFQAVTTTRHSSAAAASADGGVVVGGMDPTGTGGPWVPFRWTAAGGAVPLGTLGGPEHSYASDVSSDGLVVVGAADSPSGTHAFRWTLAGGMQDLGTLGGATSMALAVSDDGLVVVGSADLASGEHHAFRWTAAGGMQDLGVYGPHWTGFTFAQALDVNADGSVVVGNASSLGSPGGRAFRWTAATGLQDLGTFGTFDFASSAAGVDATGAIVAGGMPFPFRWVEGDRVPIGSAYCQAETNSTGQLGRLAVLGSNSVAGNFVVLSADGLPPQTFGIFLASREQGAPTPLAGSRGALCLGGQIGRFVGPGQVLPTGSGGRYSLDLDLGAVTQPGGPAAVQPGETWCFQSWYRDTFAGSVANLTDAVSVRFF